MLSALFLYAEPFGSHDGGGIATVQQIACPVRLSVRPRPELHSKAVKPFEMPMPFGL